MEVITYNEAIAEYYKLKVELLQSGANSTQNYILKQQCKIYSMIANYYAHPIWFVEQDAARGVSLAITVLKWRTTLIESVNNMDDVKEIAEEIVHWLQQGLYQCKVQHNLGKRVAAGIAHRIRTA